MRALIALTIAIQILVFPWAYAEEQKQTVDSLISQAWKSYRQQQYHEACSRFARASLSEQISQSNRALLGLAYCQKALGHNTRATDTFFKLAERKFKLDETIPALLTLLLEQNRFQEAGTTLALLPEHHQSAWQKKIYKKKLQMAWSCYDHGDHECAQTAFANLRQAKPDDPDVLLGHCYSLIQLDRKDEARNAIASFTGQKNSEINEMYIDLTKEKGLADYRAGRYAQAETALAQAVKMDADDRGIKELLEWSRYHQSRPEGLIRILEQTYNETGSAKAASDLITVLESTKNQNALDEFIRKLAQDNISDLNHLVGENYYQHVGPVTAAQFDNSPGTCYEGCANPKLSSGIFYNYRSGDEGLSQLNATGVSLTGEITTRTGNIWNLRLSAIYLDSGSAGPNPYAGSFYRSIADPGLSAGKMVEARTVYDLNFLFEKEGPNNWNLSIGSTPLNGVSSPVPIFDINYTTPSWGVHFEQSSVKESILSWIGQNDPYSDKHWGRVLKTGFTGQKTFDLEMPYWFSTEGRYHYYWGENVQDNHGLGISLSIGRTDEWNQFTRNIGLSSGAISFKDNHSFYTYGHGGYDSPKYKVSVGPFIRLITQKCESYWLDMALSLSAFMSETEDAPHYRDPDLNGLDPGFLDNSDLIGNYRGEEESEASVNVKIRGMRHLGNNWFVTGTAGFTSTTTGFREVKAGIFLQYHFNDTRSSALCDASRQIDLLMSPIN